MTSSDGSGAVLPGGQAPWGRDARGTGVAEFGHADVRDQLSRYLDDGDSFSDFERARLEDHLAACASCQAFLNTLKRTRDLARSLPPRPAPKSAKARVLNAIRSE